MNDYQDQARAYVRGAKTLINNLIGKGFEPEISAFPILIPKGGVCFHIGASDGRHSYAMVRQAGASKVYAFEPSSYSYAMLESAVWFNRLQSKVEKHQLAVGSSDGHITLTTPRKTNRHMGRAFAFIGDPDAKRSDLPWSGEKQQEIVGVTSVDNFVASRGLKRVDFIRVDCEGAEMLVLDGATKTIETYWPSMLIEVHPIQLETLFHSSGQAVLDKLKRWGYRTFIKTQSKWQERSEPIKPWKDFACLHSERNKDRIARLLSQ